MLPTLSNTRTTAVTQVKPPAKNKSTRKQTNQNLKQTTCLSHNNYWIMQILTKQTKQGASISGRRKASKEKAVIGKSDLLFLPGSLLRKSGSGLTSAGLVNGMYPLKQGYWRTKHSGGVILHHWAREEAMVWQKPCWGATCEVANQSPRLQPSSLSFPPLWYFTLITSHVFLISPRGDRAGF